MNFPELNSNLLKDKKAVQVFIDYWASRYSYKLESVYKENIGKKLTSEKLLRLYEWKNGGKISHSKLTSIQENYIGNKTFELEELKNKYLNKNNPGGPIWNIFYLHCIEPKVFPIFDQHTYRSMYFIKEITIKEIPNTKKEIYKIYCNEYIPFYSVFELEKREIDKALFTFGQYLKAVKKLDVITLSRYVEVEKREKDFDFDFSDFDRNDIKKG